MEKIRVGRIVNTFGIRGELKVEVITDFPEDRFAKGRELFVTLNGKDVSLKVASVRYHKGFAMILFEGYDNINQVEIYKGCELYIAKDAIKELKDGYYTFELVGMRAEFEDGEVIGEVKDVETYPANSVLRCEYHEKDVLIPFVDAFIMGVDKKEKRIVVRRVEGLL